MSDEMKTPGNPDRGAQPVAKPRMFTIQLKELPDYSDENTPLDEFCHRERIKLTDDYLSGVQTSLRQEKQLEAIHVFRGDGGKWRVLTGHRRIAAMYLLAKKKVAGFSVSMPVLVQEVTVATLQDQLVHSVADNEVRAALDQKERLLVVRKFARAGVPKERGAAALAISVKSYERDLSVAADEDMLNHVLADHLTPGDAAALIRAAEKQRRKKEFLDYLGRWVQRKQQEIQKLDQLQKAETDKGLKPAQLLVKNNLSAKVFDGWLESLERGTPFTDSAEFNFEAVLDKKSGRLRVDRLNFDTAEASVIDLAKLGAKLAQLGKRVLAEAKRKQQLEELQGLAAGAQAALEADPSPYDVEALREFNLDFLAPQLEKEVGVQKQLQDEPSTEEVEGTGGSPEGDADSQTDDAAE